MDQTVFNRLRSSAEDLVRDRRTLVRILSIVLILMLALILRIHESSKSDISIETGSASVHIDSMFVDISGAVVSPGVYEVQQDTRLYEVIDMAGGLTSNADTAAINRAAYVEDGQKIVIPVSYNDDSDEGSSGYPDPSHSADLSSSSGNGLININTATADELASLSGIGEVLAGRIIQYREEGRFRSIEEIRNVKGIGESVFNKIRDQITV